MNYVVQLRKYHLLSHLKQKLSILLRVFFLMDLEIFQQNGKKSMYFLDEDVYGDYKEVSPEMQTICFPMLPPVITDWNAAPMFSNPFTIVSLIFSFPSLNH